MKQSNTRSKLIVTIAALVLKQYPVKWKAAELAVATGAHVRSVERALRENEAINRALRESEERFRTHQGMRGTGAR